jgi:chromosome partitioning protein
MRTIMLLNSKGGSGKSTLAINLASYYARQGKSVVLADFDPQGSALAWLEARPEGQPPIRGVAAFKEPLRVARNTDYVVMDAPAGTRGPELTALVRRAQTVLIPVLPSATDTRAAARFVHELLLLGKVTRREVKLATIANRVPEPGFAAATAERMFESFESTATRIYAPLERFLTRLKIPFLATLRDSPAYALADQQGLSIFELGDGRAARDALQWQPLLDWLDSRRSVPNPA